MGYACGGGDDDDEEEEEEEEAAATDDCKRLAASSAALALATGREGPAVGVVPSIVSTESVRLRPRVGRAAAACAALSAFSGLSTTPHGRALCL